MSRLRAWILGLLLLAALSAFVGWRLAFLGAMPRMLTQMSIDADVDSPVTISRDGKTIAYAEVFGDDVFVHVRDVDGNHARRLEGTEGASQLFFSPDGQWLGFEAQGALKKVAVAAYEPDEPVEPVVIAERQSVSGAYWMDDDAILIGSDTGILELDTNGARRGLTRIADGERAHRFPQRLPGSDWIVFEVWAGSIGSASIEAFSVTTGARRGVVARGRMPRYAVTGHLLYLDDGSLWAVPFDAESATPTGAAFLAVTQADNEFELSNDGTLLVSRSARGDGPTLVSVMIHWHEELERLTPR